MSDNSPAIGPGGCGTWTDFEVPAIWSMLASEDEALSAAQTTAWNRTFDLLDSHAQNLRRLRDNLADRWPPSRSEASAVFLEYLDKLIESVRPASYASSSNALVLSDLTDTLAVARSRVGPLYEQWQAGGGTDPKVRAQLNAQAAAIMASTDVEVYQHGQRFVLPPEYEPPVADHGTTLPFPGSVAPNRTSTSRIRPGAASRQSPLPQRSRTSSELSNQPRDEGTLAGGRASQQLPEQQRYPNRDAKHFIETPAGRAIVPGGVIGSETGPATRSQSPWRYATSRTNTPGNEIGAPTDRPASPRSGEPALPAEQSRTTPNETSGPFGGLMAGGGAPRSRRSSRQGEAYVDWHVTTGVPPVLMASAEPADHDPGPGVIGIDR